MSLISKTLPFFAICVSLIFSFSTKAQVTAGDCGVAINICSNAGFSVDPNGFGAIDELGDGFSTGLVSNPSTNPNTVAAQGFANSGCLLSGELNSTWMIVNIASNGALEFSFGVDGGVDCYDWTMWQYDANACANIQADLLPPVACNWNGACESFTGMAGGPNGSALPVGADQSNFEDALSVVCGEQYLICFSNFSSAVTSVPLNFFGSASISCNIFNPISVTDTVICEGQCATLTAQGGLTYDWTPNPDLSAITGSTVDACPTGPGTFEYYVTGNGSCGSGVDTATVTVVSLPNPTITPAGPFSPTDPATTLTAVTPGGTWSSNCGACINPTTGVFDPAIAGTGTWQICYTAGVPPCDSTACINITVGCTPPVLDAIANVTACDSYVLPVITGTGLSGNEAYFDGIGGTGTQYAPGALITSSVTLYAYDVTGPGCSDEIPFTITIEISPDAGLDNDTVLCNNNGTLDLNNLLINADPGGIWNEITTTPSGQFTSATGVLDVSGLNGTFNFSYTVNGNAPCLPDVANIDVSIILGAPIMVSPGNLMGSCSINEHPPYPDFASFVAAGGSITGPNIQIDPSTFTLLSETSDGNTCPEVVTREYEVANECGFSDSFTQTITIMDNTPPDVQPIATLNVACPTDVPLPDVSVVNASDNCTQNPSIIHTGDVTDGNICAGETITRSYEVIDDCGNVTAVTQTIIIDAITPTVDAGNDILVCEGDQVVLTANNPDNAAISWTGGIQDGVAFMPPVGNSTFIVTADICAGHCTSTDTVIVTVAAGPSITFEGDTLSGCQPLTVNFTNLTIPSGVDCTWDFGDGQTGTGCSNVSHNYPSAGSYDVSLTIVNSAGCSGTVQYDDYITVHPNPYAQFTIVPWEIDVTDPEVQFFNSTINGINYYWDFGDSLGTSTEENPSYTYPDAPGAVYEIMLAAESEFGCVDTAYRSIAVKDVLIFYIPNAFTPDNDEFNNSFYPVFTQGYDPFDYHFVIYNRWGEILFESYDASYGWDGTYGGSELVKDGTYIWTVEFGETMSDKRHKYNGHVTIMR